MLSSGTQPASGTQAHWEPLGNFHPLISPDLAFRTQKDSGAKGQSHGTKGSEGPTSASLEARVTSASLVILQKRGWHSLDAHLKAFLEFNRS